MKTTSTRERLRTQKTALEKIDDFLTKEQGGSNAELIRRMRVGYFADVDELEKSGQVVIPK
jgi:hypothetical protein